MKAKVKVQSSDSILSCETFVAEVDIPDGWRRVWSGALLPGDLFLDRVKIMTGDVSWEHVTIPTDGAARRGRPYSSAKWFACVIREDDGGDVALPCERCECYPRAFGKRYCPVCCNIVLVAGRRVAK